MNYFLENSHELRWFDFENPLPYWVEEIVLYQSELYWPGDGRRDAKRSFLVWNRKRFSKENPEDEVFKSKFEVLWDRYECGTFALSSNVFINSRKRFSLPILASGDFCFMLEMFRSFDAYFNFAYILINFNFLCQ